MKNEISLEQWLSTLEQLNTPCTDALTAKAWSERICKTPVVASRWIQDGLNHGWMERATTWCQTLTGIPRRTIGFRLVKQEPQRRKK